MRSWRTRRSPPRENAFSVSSSITLGNLRSCMLSCAFNHIEPPPIALRLPISSQSPRCHRLWRRSLHLASLRCDLAKLRALVEKLPHSRRYSLLPNGYSICLVFLKLFERVYAPLTAGLLPQVRADAKLRKTDLRSTGSINASSTTSTRSFTPLASKPHDSPNANKIPVASPITAR